ncbi:MAG: TlpA disulfide reductase family protein [Planctomycetota bacterium]|nr:TlpA disulfide reductase family protein [Planctomycetota bacterium]
MNHRIFRLVLPSLCLGILSCPVALAQQHEPVDEAVEAFQAMIDSYGERCALTVKTEITITIIEGDLEQAGQGVEAELTFDDSGHALFKLRGYECFIADGEITAIHSETDEGYFQTPDDGSAYYMLMNMFLDVPFPHLAIALGESEPTDLYMQFHPKAPWIVPTGVREDLYDDVTCQVIEMTSDFETLDIYLDPKTKLIQFINLEVTGGFLVQAGSRLRYEHTFEYETHDEPLRDDYFAYEPGDRLRMDMIASLKPTPELGAGGAGGVRGGGQGALVGQVAPAFILESILGEVVDLEDLRDQVIVLDFWATWCGPCIQALPLLHEVAQWADNETMPVRVFAINVFEGNALEVDSAEARKNKAMDFWKKKGFTLPVLMDYSDETAKAYGVNGIPATFVIRSDGIVHSQHTGAGADYVAMLKREIADALEALEMDDQDEGEDSD